MSTAASASPAVLQRSHSTSRRGPTPSYSASAAPNHPQRTQSTTTRPVTIAAAPHRSNSHSRSYDRPSSAARPDPITLARRENNDPGAVVARPSTRRRSSSQDRATAAPPPVRPETSRNNASVHRTSSSRGQNQNIRYSTDRPPPAMGSQPMAPVDDFHERHVQAQANKGRRTTISAASGHWALGKTIGAGSMGKVKLAKRLEGGEQVAVKIVPRQSTDEGHHSNRDRERADHSKEVRTAREAAIVTLLEHPYICALRDVVRTNYHWYMLFEYVNGGQMLDYIISHGRLKEKQARKFGRQIASALDYCHRNSIVHRDLKIENILISKTGDIKIIDFGLSNLFSPRNHLKTFCGSLYFAAPELLQARQYTGPEVDVWSFGIVLYVLVCGKVPFDDQSMPELHAKIKKGIVDYPAWLSAECKHLISRMLVTDPKQRASLQEIMNHPWICKGYNMPPENWLPHREPLQLPLDEKVIQGMHGFDFGDPELISRQLTKIVESEEYQSAIRAAPREIPIQSPAVEKKRGFGFDFDFYKRRSSTTSKDNLANPSMEAVHLGSDPINAYSPLISIYYLVREKQERDRLAANPGTQTMPKSPGELPLRIPDLPAPEAAHTNDASYEIAGETSSGGRARGRSRTHGQDDVQDNMKKLMISSPTGTQPSPGLTSPIEQIPVKKESAAAGLLRRFSTRRHRDHERERPTSQANPAVALKTSGDLSAPPRKSFSVRRTRERDTPPVSMLQRGGSQPQHQDLLAPPETPEARTTKGLGRSASVNSAEHRRQFSRRGVSPTAPAEAFDDETPAGRTNRSNQKIRSLLGDEIPEPKTIINPRAATVRTKSLGHARRESIQASRARRIEAREANLPEETDQEAGAARAKPESAENVKPVYLKGLFSVQTTSTKPVAAIRSDIIRVLRQLSVNYTEIRGGFSCNHTPSIDLNTVLDVPPSPDRMNMTPNHRRRISFRGFQSERDDYRDTEKVKASNRRDTSYTNSDASEDSVTRDHRGRNNTAGETTTHVQSELGGSMILNFEIFIVKVPLLSLHGIQFKKTAGNTWQYKNMAEKILHELRL
ncbi:MAG: serine/threonine-protein kinase KIN2 [Trizodia sp. TS-e1964]|nr:MAG: serine/threonine-protein kinase KIN2 [Trizodia sp. TS-e1964]